MSLLRLRPLQHQFRRCRAVHTTASSINQDEIAHFNRLAQNWWNEQGELKHLHQMNPVRMRFIRDKLLEVARDEDPNTSLEPSNALRGLDILDVGCGGGLLSEVASFFLVLTDRTYVLAESLEDGCQDARSGRSRV